LADPNLTQNILDLVQKAASCKELKKGANEGKFRHTCKIDKGYLSGLCHILDVV